MNSIRACIFDAYGTLLDVNSAVMKNADKLGSCAEGLSALWRQRQLEYSWTRTLMGRYADFWELTIEALDFALESFGFAQRNDLRSRLLDAYFALSAYPDALNTLRTLKEHGFTTAILSNGTSDMLQGTLRAGKLTDVLDDCISVDEIKVYKPDPRVYQLACDRLQVRPDEVCFVSSNAWDIGGAGAFGFNTVRINRQNNPGEYRFAPQNHQLSTLSELSDFLQRIKPSSTR